MSTPKKSGFVAFIGRPNVGKSTLLNRILGAKIAIVTPRPQTTRDRIAGIHTEERGQMILLDSPGIHRPKRLLNDYMVRVAERIAEEADVVVHIVDDRPSLREGRPPLEDGGEEELVREVVSRVRVPKLLVLNKIDRLSPERAAEIRDDLAKLVTYDASFLLSATRGEGVRELLDDLFARLPEGPYFYPEDDLTDLPMRFIAQEIIREKLFTALAEEVPYSVAVVIEEYRDEPESDLTRIRADIYVERESQKGIVIGKGGRVLKQVGTEARKDLERETGRRIFLDLFVKVEKEWSKNAGRLKMLGYDAS